RGRPATSRLPRLRLRRLHHRHVLPGIRHHAARPPDPAHGAYPRHLVLCVRRRHRRRLGQPHLWVVPVTPPDPPLSLRVRRRSLLPLSRWVTVMGIACCHPWTGSWTGAPDNPSAPRAVNAITRAIRAASAHG